MALFTRASLARERITKGFIHENSRSILRESVLQFSKDKTYDIFVSHRKVDADDVLAVKRYIEDAGFIAYVDWIEDEQLDRSNVNKETAELLRVRMDRCKSLFFVTSENSPKSVWMPWELGYFDGLKHKVAVVPILLQDVNTDTYIGQEYLGLYPYVTKDPSNAGKMTLWVNEDNEKYISLNKWLKDEKPYKH